MYPQRSYPPRPWGFRNSLRNTEASVGFRPHCTPPILVKQQTPNEPERIRIKFGLSIYPSWRDVIRAFFWGRL